MNWGMVGARLNPLMSSWWLAGSLLVLAGISLGAGLLDVAHDPYALNAPLYANWVEFVVEGLWWVYGLVALFVYVVRVGGAIYSGRPPRAFMWMVPIELVVVVIVAGLTVVALVWLSMQFPCVMYRPPSLFGC